MSVKLHECPLCGSSVMYNSGSVVLGLTAAIICDERACVYRLQLHTPAVREACDREALEAAHVKICDAVDYFNTTGGPS